MNNTKPKESTIKVLFALSGNECAFTDCTTKLVQDKNNLIGEICHIEARKPDGARYNIYSNDEKRRSEENLIILCPTHHKLIDNDEGTYTVEFLKEMKFKHESNNRNSSLELSNRNLGKLMFDSGYYSVRFNWWRAIVIYNVLCKHYPPQEIKACKDSYIKFEVSGVKREVVISTEIDVNSIYGSLYEVEQQLNEMHRVDFDVEIICFVFCNGLIDYRYSNAANGIRMKKGACKYFRHLNEIKQRYDFNISFVYLLEDESHVDKFLILPFVSDCEICYQNCQCIPTDLSVHRIFQKLSDWDGCVIFD
ncbi:HNH endonuclease [Aeromonas hydrophila]|uniref:HNH endonuclease n=1 Tax=Aeromonas hydrophila TaxID=644 RepID=UPI0013036833|nr:HNH endonuclease [Aeromonas hydrophila]QGZ73227.1 hypothetical protein GQR50_12210 [Aeromonas hydrophila]